MHEINVEWKYKSVIHIMLEKKLPMQRGLESFFTYSINDLEIFSHLGFKGIINEIILKIKLAVNFIHMDDNLCLTHLKYFRKTPECIYAHWLLPGGSLVKPIGLFIFVSQKHWVIQTLLFVHYPLALFDAECHISLQHCESSWHSDRRNSKHHEFKAFLFKWLEYSCIFPHGIQSNTTLWYVFDCK